MAVIYYCVMASSDVQKTGKVSEVKMAVSMSKGDALPYMTELTKGKASIACINSPFRITVSRTLPLLTSSSRY